MEAAVKNIVFMGSKKIGYECLHTLIDKGYGDHIAAVFTTPTHPLDHPIENIYQIAYSNNLPIYTELNDLYAIDNIDFLISVQYNKILKPNHIAKAKKLAINLHLAPLPEYRGCNQFSFAILDERKEFGVTIHKIDSGIDSGDILFERRFAIPPQCLVYELYELSLQAGVALFKEKMEDILNLKFTPIPQATRIASYGTAIHYRSEINELKKLDINWPAEKIARHIRATWFPPFESPYYEWEGKKMFVSLTN